MKKKLMLVALLGLLALPMMAQTDATDIAEGAQAAFVVVAPIVITISVFFVGVKIARRVVR